MAAACGKHQGAAGAAVDNIRISDLTAALSELTRESPADSAGYTTAEIAAALGGSVATAGRQVREGVRAGAVTIGWRTSQSIIGARIRVPVYCLRRAAR